MAKKPSVHVVARADGWAVVREGNDRATSVRRTQAEAAREGRDIARRHETEFLLHGKDGQIREHNDYGSGHRPQEEIPSGQATESFAPGTRTTAGSASEGADQPADRSGREATDTHPGGETLHEGTDDTKEVRGVTDEQRDDRLGPIKERYANYEVYDRDGERLGKVNALFLDEADRPGYVGVKIGLLAARTSLIPGAVVMAEDERRRLVISRPKGVVQDGPSFEDADEVTLEFEERVHHHYGLPSAPSTEGRGGYDPLASAEGQASGRQGDDSGAVGPGMRMGDTESGEFRGHGREPEGVSQPGSDLQDRDELRVQRSEEELRVGTREREAGSVNVRKRVRVDREQVRVPTRREEVTVERVPVEGEASEAQIGDDEIRVPVTREEVVVEKRPVVKEEIRLRKEVVEDTEMVEQDVRREEVEIDDETTRRDRGRR
jgi:uncharacterized protein (TIGR02271 family)